MSPYSSKESNLDFVSFIGKLKKKIDSEFDFLNKNIESEEEDFAHPLKQDD